MLMETERKWTPAQKDAMDTRGKTLLVSAAAGSGKTATLTQRIINSLTNEASPSDIGKMLIVTFTRAAAAELRSRISEALTKELAKNPSSKHLNSQILKLASAQICTIDAFYIDLIRTNFSHLGISPNFRIADGAEDALLASSVMSDVVDSFYETEPDFPRLVECFGGARSIDNVNNVFISLSVRCANIPEGILYLKNFAEELQEDSERDFFASHIGKVIRDESVDFADHAINGLSLALEHIEASPEFTSYYHGAFFELLEYCQKLLELLRLESGGYNACRDHLSSYIFPALPKGKKKFDDSEEMLYFKSIRTDINADIKALYSSSFATPPDSVRRAMADTARYTMIIYRLLAEFEKRMDEEKKRRNYMTFSDVRRYALKLLVDENGEPSSIAKAYSEHYTDIYIDEYQDVDRVQDLIFSSISKKDNRFMVGDIKQSIYGFRGAEPLLFAEYREAFPDLHSDKAKDSDNASIFMSSNFRCDKNIIDFTNAVCSYLFKHCGDNLGYTKKDDLEWGKVPPNEDYVSPLVHVDVIIPPKRPTPAQIRKGAPDIDPKLFFSNDEYEAKFIAAEIKRLIDSETLANGKKIRPSDIAILTRKHSPKEILTRELNALGIKTSSGEEDRYFADPDVMMMICLLNAIDNPHRDIYLAGVLRSPIFEFTLEEMISIRSVSDNSRSLYDSLLVYSEQNDLLAGKCKSFLKYLEEWRDHAASMPVDRLLRTILDSELVISSGLESNQSEGDGGNLLLLYEYARKFENGSFKGLGGFIDFINTMMEDGRKIEAPEKPLSEDQVVLITSHHSKGLEFPVCFLFGCSKRFTDPSSTESLVFDHHVGLALKLSDGSSFATINTPLRKAIFTRKKISELEEEMRILYVAMTRARERLYITATGASEEKMIAAAKTNAFLPSRYSLLSSTSYIQWILTALEASDRKDFYELNFHELPMPNEDQISEIESQINKGERVLTEENKATVEPEEKLLALLEEKFSFEYGYKELKRVPAKISVSRLSPDVLDENDTSVDLINDKKTSVPDFFRGGIKKSKKATDRGTATHLFLQFCDFSNALKNGVREEFNRLYSNGFLPKDAKELIRFEELEKFFESELCDIIMSAKKIIREQRFNLLLPPDEFTRDKELLAKIKDESLAVQGVIDLIVIDKDDALYLFDYKTDRLTKEELESDPLASQRLNGLHAMQLSYYKKAAELLFDRSCVRVAVYSTHAAKLFDIEPIPLDYPKDIL
jgi:ATP-dependent helicase/nuclease subunit A